jgi:RND family efflux transporter MFP subunit
MPRGSSPWALLVPLALAACEPQAARGPAAEQAGPRAVRVARVTSSAWPRSVHVVGSLEPHERATLAIQVPGRLQELRVDVGARVAAGEVVAALDPTDLALEVGRAEAALAESLAQLGLGPDGGGLDGGGPPRPEEGALVELARAQLDEARANHQRAVILRERGITTQAEFDAAEAALRAAQSRLEDATQEWERRMALLQVRRAELAQARRRLAEARLVATFAGVILGRHAAPGDVLSAGAPVATLVRVDPLRLVAEVPEREAPLVAPGQLLRLTVEGRGAPVEGRLARVSPQLSPETRMLRVEADLPNPDGSLRAGTFCRVEVVVEEAALALTLPPAALRTFAGLDKALVVRDGKAVEVRLTLGRREPGRVEVLSGLEAGAQVVLDPGSIASGAPVTVSGAAGE